MDMLFPRVVPVLRLRAVGRVCNLLFYLLAVASLPAQSNEGTKFWFGFMEHYDVGQNSMVVMVTSKYNTSGTVRMPKYNWQSNFTVSANDVTLIKLPAYAENTGSEKLADKGVLVETVLPVSVYIHQYHSMRSEASMVLPVTSLGREYYSLSYRGFGQDGVVYPSEFLIVGIENETEITIRVRDETVGGQPPGSEFTVLLDAGETYQIQARWATGDLSGSYITGDKNFNLFAGCRWIPMPAGCDYRDNLLEQMLPVATWGKQFVTAPHAQMPYDIFRVMASENGTQVTVTDTTTVQFSLDAGEFYEYHTGESTYINANKPIAVAQYIIGSNCSGYGIGDPAMVILNSIEQIRDTVTLYNSAFENIVENYITVILKTQDLDVTSFDGQPIANLAGVFPVTGNTAFSFARLKVKAGAHTIISGGCGVIATAYGYGDLESYAYGGGASFKQINATSLIPEGGCLNDTIIFKTEFKPPRHHLLWDFGDGTTSTDPNFAHVYDALGTYTVILYLTDNCLNIKDTVSREILISLRQAVTGTGDKEACVGEAVALGAEDLPGSRYEWTGPNNFSSSEQYPLLTNIQIAAAGQYTVVGNISGCKTWPAFAEVTVHPPPQPKLGNDTLACADDSAPLVILNPGSFSQYQWQNSSTGPTFNVVQEGTYWVLVTDANGCTAADSIFVREFCPTRYYIPNVFSPNDDGINDYFSVFSSDMETLQLSIFDRWGNMLFESEALDAQWDGRFRGQPVSPGVYLWVAQITGYGEDGQAFTTTASGSVTLVR